MASYMLLRAVNYRSASPTQKFILLLRYISKAACVVRWKYGKIVSECRRTLSASLDFQVHTERVQGKFCFSRFHIWKYNLKNSPPKRLHYTVMKKRKKNDVEKSLQSRFNGGGIGQELCSTFCSSPFYNLIPFFWSNHGPAEHNSTAIKLSVIFN